MRKKIFSSVFALALLATAGWGVNKSMNYNASLSDLALKNVIALAVGENPGGGGTSVGFCYINNPFQGAYGLETFCNSDTDENTIYPCGSKSYGSWTKNSIDRCTK